MQALQIGAGVLIALALAPSVLVQPALAAPVSIHVQYSSIHPGGRQTITVHGSPPVPYQIQVTMPDGETLSAPAPPAGASGIDQWSFIQPPGTITHASRSATVRLVASGQTTTARYAIAFDPIDIVAPLQPVPENSEVVLWIHTQPRAQVTVQFSEAGLTTDRTVVTGPGGWVSMRTHFENDSSPFEPVMISLIATAVVRGKDSVARADFQVLPFQFQVSLGDVKILHQVAGAWVQTTSAHPGETLRVQVNSFITEPAGDEPLCVSGYVSVLQNHSTMQMAPLQCDSAGTNVESADLQLAVKLAPGPAEVDIDASFENGSAHVVVPITVMPGQMNSVP